MGLAPSSLAVLSALPKLSSFSASGSQGPEGNKKEHESLEIGQGGWRWGVWQRSPPCQKQVSCRRRTGKLQSVPGRVQSPDEGLVPPKGAGMAAPGQVSHAPPVPRLTLTGQRLTGGSSVRTPRWNPVTAESH